MLALEVVGLALEVVIVAVVGGGVVVVVVVLKFSQWRRRSTGIRWRYCGGEVGWEGVLAC